MKGFWMILTLLAVGALAAACGDGEQLTDTPSTTPTAPATPSATAEPAATPTPSAAAVPSPTATVSAPVPARIAFVSDRDGNGEIYVMSDDGSGLARLTDSPASESNPTWSPDGSYIAFSSGFEIYVMNADGSGLANLTNNPADEGVLDDTDITGHGSVGSGLRRRGATHRYARCHSHRPGGAQPHSGACRNPNAGRRRCSVAYRYG